MSDYLDNLTATTRVLNLKTVKSQLKFKSPLFTKLIDQKRLIPGGLGVEEQVDVAFTDDLVNEVKLSAPHPGGDKDTMARYKSLVANLDHPIERSGLEKLLNAPKGTRLYNRLLQEGRLLGDISGDSTDLSINFMPRMGYRQLVEGYSYLVGNIYSPGHFYRRIITFLKNYRRPKTRSYPLRLCYVKAFFHGLWTLGIKGRERFHYWKALLWTIFRRPRFVPLCMGLAIYGYHFRRLFEEEWRAAKLRLDAEQTAHSTHPSALRMDPLCELKPQASSASRRS